MRMMTTMETTTLALAGDTMLGRLVAERLATVPPRDLFDDGVVEIAKEADLFVLNLECAISDRGERWPDPGKPFFFRGPPAAVEVLTYLGVGCVSLANNHALDYGTEALLDTIRRLDDAGIAAVGAGADVATARRPAILRSGDRTIGLVGLTDHPADFAAGAESPGVAYADLRRERPHWVLDTVRVLAADPAVDIVVATPHWGPNMVPAPVAHVRHAAADLLAAGAGLVAGHSAHVVHGVGRYVLYDLGDFIDDYATHPSLRNDLGMMFLVTYEGDRPTRVEGVPLALDFCRTRLADGDDARWMAERFRAACAALGTEVDERDGRLVIEWDLIDRPPPPSEVVR